jgi:beta-glucosidase
MINLKNQRVVEPGWFNISVGGEQPGFEGRTDSATTSTVSGRFQLTGETMVLD